MYKRKVRNYFDISRVYKYIKLKLMRHPATPNDIALSVAIGVFIGIMPTFGVASILSITVAIALNLPKLPCFLGTLISNPWTTPLFYMVSLKIGNFFLKTEFTSVKSIISDVLNAPKESWHALKVFIPLNLGGLFIAIPIAVLIYYLVLGFLIELKIIKEKKRKKKQQDLF
ncbi:MAG: hypothetical protein C0601_07785 [Candidatus Muiribacterium halophilum]|uniref:DUF2062 domain-containing protein n=1 Tax=Muiribacterium halophilum TaxID=2053465 RepID=A0A2N5ZFP1_MUIH1|nr:MAG: hypothetical protein C0601_07785 [Candidatus Muirbacterium halophilum]